MRLRLASHIGKLLCLLSALRSGRYTKRFFADIWLRCSENLSKPHKIVISRFWNKTFALFEALRENRVKTKRSEIQTLWFRCEMFVVWDGWVSPYDELTGQRTMGESSSSPTSKPHIKQIVKSQWLATLRVMHMPEFRTAQGQIATGSVRLFHQKSIRSAGIQKQFPPPPRNSLNIAKFQWNSATMWFHVIYY